MIPNDRLVQGMMMLTKPGGGSFLCAIVCAAGTGAYVSVRAIYGGCNNAVAVCSCDALTV